MSRRRKKREGEEIKLPLIKGHSGAEQYIRGEWGNKKKKGGRNLLVRFGAGNTKNRISESVYIFTREEMRRRRDETYIRRGFEGDDDEEKTGDVQFPRTSSCDFYTFSGE